MGQVAVSIYDEDACQLTFVVLQLGGCRLGHTSCSITYDLFSASDDEAFSGTDLATALRSCSLQNLTSDHLFKSNEFTGLKKGLRARDCARRSRVGPPGVFEFPDHLLLEDVLTDQFVFSTRAVLTLTKIQDVCVILRSLQRLAILGVEYH